MQGTGLSVSDLGFIVLSPYGMYKMVLCHLHFKVAMFSLTFYSPPVTLTVIIHTVTLSLSL